MFLKVYTYFLSFLSLEDISANRKGSWHIINHLLTFTWLDDYSNSISITPILGSAGINHFYHAHLFYSMNRETQSFYIFVFPLHIFTKCYQFCEYFTQYLKFLQYTVIVFFSINTLTYMMYISA